MKTIKNIFKIINKKDNKGITVISLIVIIIVLLILSGISISAVVGKNGLIEKAGEAKDSNSISQEREILQEAAINALGQSEKGDVEKEILKVVLEKYPEVDTDNISGSESEIEVPFKSGRTYTVNSSGKVTIKTTGN